MAEAIEDDTKTITREVTLKQTADGWTATNIELPKNIGVKKGSTVDKYSPSIAKKKLTLTYDKPLNAVVITEA